MRTSGKFYCTSAPQTNARLLLSDLHPHHQSAFRFMDPGFTTFPILALPLEVFETIVTHAWLCRDLSTIGNAHSVDHRALFNSLSLVSRHVRQVIARIAWTYVFIGGEDDVVRYHYLYHGNPTFTRAALALATHKEVHIHGQWLLTIEDMIKETQYTVSRLKRTSSERSIRAERFLDILQTSPTPQSDGAISLRRGSPEIHMWDCYIDQIVELQAHDKSTAEQLKKLWLHNTSPGCKPRSSGDIQWDWCTSSSPAKCLEQLRVFMHSTAQATWGNNLVPFNVIYPNLKILELNHSTSLLPVFPLLPRSLDTLILDVPLVHGAPYGNVYFWSLARCFRECYCLRGEWKPRIVLRTGREEPSGWSEAQAAASIINILLERMVVFSN
jgi:hypothetical protein